VPLNRCWLPIYSTAKVRARGVSTWNLTVVCTGQYKTEVVTRKLAAHIEGVARIRGFDSARCVLAIEANFANEAEWVERALTRYRADNPGTMPPLEFLREETGAGRRSGCIGVLTTDETKADMARMLQMAVDSHRFAFHPAFFTADNTPDGRHKMRKAITTQLSNYERIIQPRVGNPHAPPTIVFSGKQHGPDDLAICAQINVLGHNRYFVRRAARAQRTTSYPAVPTRRARAV
jgi:hypothetical protein